MFGGHRYEQNHSESTHLKYCTGFSFTIALEDFIESYILNFVEEPVLEGEDRAFIEERKPWEHRNTWNSWIGGSPEALKGWRRLAGFQRWT